MPAGATGMFSFQKRREFLQTYLISLRSYSCHPDAHTHIFTLR